MRRIRDELPVDAPNAGSAERSLPWNIADHQRSGCADDGEHVRIVFAVRAENDALDLDFVVPALRKERTNRTINQSRSENFLFGRAAFAFEVTTRKFSGGGSFFAVIDSKWEEILACLCFDSTDGCDD